MDKLPQPSIWQRSLSILGFSALAHQTTNKLQVREWLFTDTHALNEVFYHSNNSFNTGMFMGAAGITAYACGARSPYAIGTGACVGGVGLNRILESSLMKPVAEHFPNLVVSHVADTYDFAYGTVAAVGAALFIARAK